MSKAIITTPPIAESNIKFDDLEIGSFFKFTDNESVFLKTDDSDCFDFDDNSLSTVYNGTVAVIPTKSTEISVTF